MAKSEFGDLLRHHRSAAGLSQEELAEKAGMSARGIDALERGDRRYPYRETVVLLSRALNLTPAAAAEMEASAARPRQQRALADPDSGDVRGTVTNLPLQPTNPIGRETEIAEIVGILGGAGLLP